MPLPLSSPIAAVGVLAFVVVPDVALLESGEIGIAFIGGFHFFQRVDKTDIEPKIGGGGFVKDGFKGDRDATGRFIIGPEISGPGIG